MNKYEQKKYAEFSKEIDQNLNDIIDEFSKAIAVLKNEKDFVRIRFLLCFSFLEVICTIYNSFYNLSLTNSKLLPQWIKNYCLKIGNQTYDKHPYFKMIDEGFLYNFRNSIIHAFGLPEQLNGISVICPDKGNEYSPLIKKIELGMLAKGHKVVFISPNSLLQLLLNGFEKLHSEIFLDPSKATRSEFDGLKRIQKEMRRRGGKFIPLP